MRRFVFLLACAGAAAAPGRFAGEWVATFKGTTICTLEIEEPGGKLAGVSKACKISVDQKGDLIDAAAPDGDQMPQPFVNPKVEGSTLTYELIEDDGERMKFEFRLTAERKAELRFVGAIVIKPIRFDRR